MPPAAPFAPLGRVSVRPVSKVPPGVWLAFAPILKMEATGAPRVSIDRPRLGWLPLTKSRSEPRRMRFQL